MNLKIMKSTLKLVEIFSHINEIEGEGIKDIQAPRQALIYYNLRLQ